MRHVAAATTALALASAAAAQESDAIFAEQTMNDMQACTTEPISAAACERIITNYNLNAEFRGDAVALSNRGIAYAQLGRFEEALTDFGRALASGDDRIDREQVAAWAQQVRDHLATSSAAMPGYADLETAFELHNAGGDPAEIVRLVDAAFAAGVGNDENTRTGLYIRQAALVKLENYARAKDDLDALLPLVDTDSERAQLLKARAETFVRLKKLDAAEADFGAALAGDLSDAERVDAAGQRALLRRARGDFQGVVDDLDLVAQSGVNLNLLAVRAEAHQQLGNWDAAAADLTQIINLGVDDPANLAEAYRQRAAVATVQGDLAAAQADYESALAIQPNARIRVEYGDALLKDGLSGDAAYLYEEALADPDAPQTYRDLAQLGLAKTWHDVGDVGEAIPAYEAFFARLTGDEPAPAEVQRAALELFQLLRDAGHYTGDATAYDAELRAALRACIEDPACRSW